MNNQRTIVYPDGEYDIDTGELVEHQGFVLRDYQQDTINRVRESMVKGNKRVILQAGCGAGKTCMFSEIAKKAYENGHKVLFLANRRELIFQAKKTLEACGLVCGVIMAGEESNLDAQVQIASQQTYVKRMDLEELQFNRWWHDASLICCDECHSSISPSYQKILNGYAGKFIVGLTATPCRGDSRGLGEYYDDIVSAIDVVDLIEQKYLVPVRYFAPSTPDLAKIKKVAGDYDKKELGIRVNTPRLVGDIYDNWSIICPDRPTIIFATNVKHSISICDAFLKQGVQIAHIDARTPPVERESTLNRLRSGELRVITNVGILCEGFDFPEASCVILARPTKSLGLYIQMGGRGLRTAPLKEDCIILDHSGCVEEHGRLEWPREWTLDGKEKAWSEPKVKEKEKSIVKCSVCHELFSGESECPVCHSPIKSFGKPIETIDAELVESKGKQKITTAEKRIFWGMTEYYRIKKGFKPGWAAHFYKNKTGVWPRNVSDVAPIEPNKEFMNWIKYCNIKKAKSNGGESVRNKKQNKRAVV